MVSVELVDQFWCIPEILCRFPARPYITVTRPLYKIMEFPVASLNVENPVNFPFVIVVDDHRLRFQRRLAGSRRCIAVEQRDVQKVVLPDRIPEVQFVSIVSHDLNLPCTVLSGCNPTALAVLSSGSAALKARPYLKPRKQPRCHHHISSDWLEPPGSSKEGFGESPPSQLRKCLLGFPNSG